MTGEKPNNVKDCTSCSSIWMNWPRGSSVRKVWFALNSLCVPSIPWTEIIGFFFYHINQIRYKFSAKWKAKYNLVICQAEGVSARVPLGSMATRSPLCKEVCDEVRHQFPLQLGELLLQVVLLVLLAHHVEFLLRLSHPLD